MVSGLTTLLPLEAEHGIVVTPNQTLEGSQEKFFFCGRTHTFCDHAFTWLYSVNTYIMWNARQDLKPFWDNLISDVFQDSRFLTHNS